MWSHDWSGICEVRCGGRIQSIDLYGHVGGCARLRIAAIESNLLEVRPGLEKNEASKNYQAIIYRTTFSRDA